MKYDVITNLNMPKPRGKRAIRSNDRIEFQMITLMRASNRLGACNGFIIIGKPDHDKFARLNRELGGRSVRKENSVSVQSVTAVTFAYRGHSPCLWEMMQGTCRPDLARRGRQAES